MRFFVVKALRKNVPFFKVKGGFDPAPLTLLQTIKKKALYVTRPFLGIFLFKIFRCTDGDNILHTPIVKQYNDLLERQCSVQGKNEVSYFYVGEVFCIHHGTKYANFQEKIFAELDFWEKVPNFGYYIKNPFYVIHKVRNFFPEIPAKIFS